MFAKSIVTRSGDVFRDEFSVAFDGTNDYLYLGSQTNSGDVIAVTAWVKLKASQIAPVIIIGDFMIRFQDATDLRVWGDVSGTSSNVTIDSVLNKWTHIAVSHNAGENKIYLNGVLVDTETDTTLGNGARASYIGRYSSGYFEGNISEVAIYNSTLSANQVKTIYNGREPYNHKEGVASGNLQAWYRMGDNPLDKYPLITDSTNSTVSSNILTNPNFDSNITGWDDYSSGTVSHETSIVYSGSGSLKTTFDGTNDWAFKTTNNFTLETNSMYLIEGYCYIPSSNGASNLEPFFTTGGTFGGYSHTFIKGDSSLTNQWQYISNVTMTGTSDTSGKLFGNALNNPDNGDILYWDNITLRKINGSPALFNNMSANDIEGDTP